MKNSYYDHSSDTEEFYEGRNARLAEDVLKEKLSNPYFNGGEDSKKWLDWQLGYESRERETMPESIPTIFEVTFEPLPYCGV